MTDEEIYDLECSDGHRFSVDATELEEYIEDDSLHCKTCGKDVELCEELSLECYVCAGTYPVTSMEEARDAAESPCAHCLDLGGGNIYFGVSGSWSFRIAEYEWSRDPANPKHLKRVGREDYWEGVIHFCTRANFVSIFSERRIRASGTGYFGLPAVCLTDTPVDFSAEIKANYGEYGFVFKKSEIIAAGGNPAIYMKPELIEAQRLAGGFAPAMKPFINLVRLKSIHTTKTHYDYLHDREWRVPGDIDLSQVQPFAIIIPGETTHEKFSGSDRDTLLSAAMTYQEL